MPRGRKAAVATETAETAPKKRGRKSTAGSGGKHHDQYVQLGLTISYYRKLKGLSQQVHSVRDNTLTSMLDVGLLVLLLPRCGLGGFLAAYTVSHALNFFLSIRRLLIVTGYLPRFRTTFRSAFCCAV